MWPGANKSEEIISKIERVIMPLNKNKADEMIESASVRKILFFLKQTVQIAQ